MNGKADIYNGNRMYHPSAQSERNSTYKYIKTFKPLRWQRKPWNDMSPVILLSGSAGGGKALDITTPILTMSGWKTMGTVEVGDVVFDERGEPCSVTAVTEIMNDRPCYEVEFSSGEVFVADEKHQWTVSNTKQRRAWQENLRRNITPDKKYQSVKTTKQLHKALEKSKRSVHAVRVAEAIKTPMNEPMMIHPYVLGVWLGDGHSSSGTITIHDDDFFIIEEVLRYGYSYGGKKGKYSHSIVGLGFHIQEMGLQYNKHIPEEYFTASVDDRMALLQGIMDTDGSIDKKGRVEICQVDEGLIDDILRLISTLGIRANVIANRAGYHGYKDNGVGYRVDCGTRYRISFYTNKPIFRLPRKLERCTADTTDRTRWRYIKRVEKIDSVPVRCIQVDSPSHQFLAGKTLVPTHNSVLAAEKVHAFCLKYPNATALVLRKTRSSLTSSTLVDLRRKVIGDDPRVVHNASEQRFIYDNGSIITYDGMSDPKARERIRSRNVDIAWLEEATQFDEEDYNEVLARMRGQAAPWRQVILSTNPDGPLHWINIRMIIGNEAKVYYSGAIDNPHNPPSYLKSLEKLTGVQKERLVYGRWVAGSGLIFDTWVDNIEGESTNVTADAEIIQGGGDIIWAIDDGYSGTYNPTAGVFTGNSHPRAILLIQRRKDGTLVVADESYAIKTLASNHISELLEKWPRPKMVIRDRAAASIDGACRENNIKNVVYNTMNVDESIKEMRTWIAPDENGVRRVIVNPRCKMLRYEMSQYSTNNDGRIIKEHDNGVDALRYAIWNESYGRGRKVDIVTWKDMEAMYA